MLETWSGKRLMPWRRRFLERFCRAVLPGAAEGLPDPVALGTVDWIERYIAGLNPLVRLGMMGLLDLLNFLAIFWGYFRPMTRLRDETVRRYLHRLEGSRVYLLRNGFTAAKALAMVVYYSEPSVERRTGYADDCLVEGPGGGAR